jgi:hypothetical protein
MVSPFPDLMVRVFLLQIPADFLVPKPCELRVKRAPMMGEESNVPFAV